MKKMIYLDICAYLIGLVGAHNPICETRNTFYTYKIGRNEVYIGNQIWSFDYFHYYPTASQYGWKLELVFNILIPKITRTYTERMCVGVDEMNYDHLKELSRTIKQVGIESVYTKKGPQYIYI